MTDFVINTLIVEDDKVISTKLNRIVQEFGGNVIGIAKSSSEALRGIEKQNPDLILLDINIKGNLNGISLALSVKHLNIPILLLLHPNKKYDVDQISRVEHFGILKRPINLESFKDKMNELLEKHYVIRRKKWNPPSLNSLVYKKRGQLERVDIDSILYVKAADDYTITVTDKGDFVSSQRLFNMQESLEKFGFFKTHRSYLVNPKKIDSISIKKDFFKIGIHKIPISRNSKSQVTSIYKDINANKNLD